MNLKQILLASHALCVLSAQAQNLIVNGDFQSGNTNFSSDYLYSPANMWPEGTYCVVANPHSVQPEWSYFGDHTTGRGLMLVANGDLRPNSVVWRQTVGVSTNAAYLFSGWAASAFPTNAGRLQFFVNGAKQGSAVNLPSTTGLWQNYSAIWNSGPWLSALLEIHDLRTDGYGNDFVLDDLSLRRLSSTVPPPLFIQRAVGDAVELRWLSASNQLYQIQWTPALGSNQWFCLGAPVPGTGATVSVPDQMAGNAQRFYRLLTLD